MTNILLIIAASIMAYIFTCFFTYIEGKVAQYKLWKQSKDELYLLRTKKELRKMQNYYYTLAVNSPMELSRYLAVQAVKSKRRG